MGEADIRPACPAIAIAPPPSGGGRGSTAGERGGRRGWSSTPLRSWGWTVSVGDHVLIGPPVSTGSLPPPLKVLKNVTHAIDQLGFNHDAQNGGRSTVHSPSLSSTLHPRKDLPTLCLTPPGWHKVKQGPSSYHPCPLSWKMGFPFSLLRFVSSGRWPHFLSLPSWISAHP